MGCCEGRGGGSTPCGKRDDERPYTTTGTRAVGPLPTQTKHTAPTSLTVGHRPRSPPRAPNAPRPQRPNAPNASQFEYDIGKSVHRSTNVNVSLARRKRGKLQHYVIKSYILPRSDPEVVEKRAFVDAEVDALKVTWRRWEAWTER